MDEQGTSGDHSSYFAPLYTLIKGHYVCIHKYKSTKKDI